MRQSAHLATNCCTQSNSHASLARDAAPRFQAASGQLPLRLGRLGESLRRPPFAKRLPHQVRLALREAADRRVAVEVGGKGVALGAGGDSVVDVLARGSGGKTLLQDRIECDAHFQPVDAFHGAPIGARDLQQVRDPPGGFGAVDNLYLPFAAFAPPPGITGGGNNANEWLQVDRVRIVNVSDLANIEGNYRARVSEGFDLLCGLRYLNVSERFDIESDQDGLTARGGYLRFDVTYRVGNALQHHLPLQVGFELGYNPNDWIAAGMFTKLMAGVNFYSVDASVFCALMASRP